MASLDGRLKVTKVGGGLGGRVLVARVEEEGVGEGLKVAVVYAPDLGKGKAAMERFFN